MPLRAVLMHNVPQTDAHHDTRHRHPNGPVGIYAAAVVLACVAEVDKAAFVDCPVGSHAFACLVGPECLSSDDIDQPARVEGFEGADDEVSNHVAEGARVKVSDQSVGVVGVIKALFWVGEAPLELCTDSADEVVRCMGSLTRHEPDADFDGE